jgi:hypothetical protein
VSTDPSLKGREVVQLDSNKDDEIEDELLTGRIEELKPAMSYIGEGPHSSKRMINL